MCVWLGCVRWLQEEDHAVRFWIKWSSVSLQGYIVDARRPSHQGYGEGGAWVINPPHSLPLRHWADHRYRIHHLRGQSSRIPLRVCTRRFDYFAQFKIMRALRYFSCHLRRIFRVISDHIRPTIWARVSCSMGGKLSWVDIGFSFEIAPLVIFLW